MLAVGGGHQHAAELRGAQPAGGRGCARPDPEREGQGRDRRLPAHLPADDDAGAGAPADHEQPGAPPQAVDPVFQTKMLDMLKQTGRQEMVVGWYHSHPGFGCWLSGVDINTQQSFEALNPRAVAVVLDPIQSVKGKVVIDAFRLISPQTMMLGQEPRQTTSNLGHLHKPSIQALIHGLNRHYYSIALSYKQNELEQQMLMNLHKKNWTDGLKLTDYVTHADETEKTVTEMKNLSDAYGEDRHGDEEP